MLSNNQNKIVSAFLNPEFYDYPVNHVQLVETHISWIFLTGLYAYKLKKPVDFGFLNFTTLAQRKYYCQQELKLNKRFSPDIYLDVIPVTESQNGFSLTEQGNIINYVVKMKQFDQRCLLTKLIEKKQINLSDIGKLSKDIATFHNKIDIADFDSHYGSPEAVLKPVEENFAILNNLLFDSIDQQILKSIYEQILLLYKSISTQLHIRKTEGYIRECHGDLHLGNIALIKNQILLFDGIEFNDNLRWIDTISDCAFLIMDLQEKKQYIFANHFLNQYLLITGDYSSLLVLKFYLCYRAMVRAKVAGLRLELKKSCSMTYKNTLSEIRTYLELAQSYVQTDSQIRQPFLAISFGISGSGKSWLSSQLADQLGAIQLRSDVERKRLFSKRADELYSDSTTQQTYTHLIELSESVLTAGYPVIVDATFLDKKWRQQFSAIAKKYQIPFYILSCYADQKIIIKCLENRHNEKNNVSDADRTIMKKQLKNNPHLDLDEKEYEIPVDTGELLDCSSIMDKLN